MAVRAQLVAESVSVVCPKCGETQPNKQDGSEQWTPENFMKSSGRYVCVSCDQTLIVVTDSKVSFR